MIEEREDKEELLLQAQAGKDEMNLVEFPITLLSKRHTSLQKTLEFYDTIHGENGKSVRREWVVTGSDKYGLSLAFDNDVLIALLHIGKQSNFSSPMINFSRYRLLKLMGLADKGQNYKRIEEALNRLAGVRIYAKNAFWDNEKKGYYTINLGIIDSYALFDSSSGKNGSQESFPLSNVVLNSILYKSIQSGYIKNIDIQLYFSLKSAISKRLYRYLDKKKYGKGKFEIKLFTLAYAHLGFEKETYKYASLIKEKLTPCHEELITAGFLKSAEYRETADKTSEKVVYIFRKDPELPGETSIEKTLDDGVGEPEETADSSDEKLLDALLDAGITRIIAEQLIKEYPVQAIKTQVETLPFRKPRDPAAVLVRSIQEGWAPPGAFQEKTKKKDDKIKKERASREEEMKARRREKIEEYLSSLSRDDLAVLTQEARDLAQKEGGSLFKGKILPPYYVKSYLHKLVEERLGL